MKSKLKKNKVKITLAILFILISLNIGYLCYKKYTLNPIANKVYFAKDNLKIIEIIDANKELNLTKYIYDICSKEELSSDKLYCTNDYVQAHYKYRDVGDTIYTIDEMFEDGADCKSYSFYYATLADMMGFEYTFILIGEGHVATIVPFENGYCLLDQSFANCVGYYS